MRDPKLIEDRFFKVTELYDQALDQYITVLGRQYPRIKHELLNLTVKVKAECLRLDQIMFELIRLRMFGEAEAVKKQEPENANMEGW